jgi:hypothetical protein
MFFVIARAETAIDGRMIRLSREIESHMRGGGRELWTKFEAQLAQAADPKNDLCGRLRVSKGFLHECSIGRCSHVFGLSVRFT